MTPLEISARLEELGYPHQAAKVASGHPEPLLETAHWLTVEAGYVKSQEVALELLGYSLELKQTAELERLLGT